MNNKYEIIYKSDQSEKNKLVIVDQLKPNTLWKIKWRGLLEKF